MYHNIPTWQEKLTSCAGEKDHQSRMSQLVYIIIASRAKLTLLSSLEGHYEHELRLDNYFFQPDYRACVVRMGAALVYRSKYRQSGVITLDSINK